PGAADPRRCAPAHARRSGARAAGSRSARRAAPLSLEGVPDLSRSGCGTARAVRRRNRPHDPGERASSPPCRRRLDRSLVAPDRRLAVAAPQDVAVGVLRPLRAARPLLSAARERARPSARGRACLLAVLGCDADRGVAAVTLARVDPPGVAPPGILRRDRAGRTSEEQRDGGCPCPESHGSRCSTKIAAVALVSAPPFEM